MGHILKLRRKIRTADVAGLGAVRHRATPARRPPAAAQSATWSSPRSRALRPAGGTPIEHTRRWSAAPAGESLRTLDRQRREIGTTPPVLIRWIVPPFRLAHRPRKNGPVTDAVLHST
ncbi:hypothetical protein GCM10017687_13270 [Streptomyces echinatus]